MLDCNCPLPSALTTIPYDSCQEVWAKAARLIFQRLDDSGNTFVTGVNPIGTASSWSALPTAIADTKVVITPMLENAEFAEQDNLDDSENIDGAPFAVGVSPQLFTAEMRLASPATIAALKELECEPNLTVYAIDNKGKFLARLIGADHAGIKVSRGTFRVKEFVKGSGRGDVSKHMIAFYLPDGWYSDSAVVVPDSGFNPVYDITP